ncbi:uncharacterized protein PV09_03806 [Verruconis gallopava]|uniref:CCZ1/INTU/HSP4 first Longin domain-containing protein n=1 Tax=Verruconis gallopava TaxID=253628 RepID=A0A0D2B1R1_9PEZI|nr:uncharacterized protein PV09_03806 [Verruconis gallopava]KIW05274.1 hypothetical protein PV09_03806 [Verruconis gallopava]
MTTLVPAQLSFLAIYNPELGRTDETFRDQVVYWFSRSVKERRKDGARALQDDENEKLRQIGLAQGMVDFAKSFANGQPVDSIDTEKSRIVVHELEANWWILASIDLTKVPTNAQPASSDSKGKEHETASSKYEYSSREVAPAQLLHQQIVDGHRTFLLHNGSSLSALHNKLSRQKFCGLLERFWNRFCHNWDVLLHGNPAVEVFGGLKLAAGGELGMGVGEEEWGSGEREVLEDFAKRTDGLVDLTVSRFGEPSSAQVGGLKLSASKGQNAQGLKELDIWLGAGNHAQAGDGIVFSGVGALSRASLRDISRWTQDIYAYGESAYGVGLSPSNDRRKRKRRQPAAPADKHSSESLAQNRNKPPIPPKVKTPPGIPPPIVSAVERSLERATSSHDIRKAKAAPERKDTEKDESSIWTRYLTLGYGSAWGTNRNSTPIKREDSTTLDIEAEHEPEPVLRQVDPEPEAEADSDLDPEAELEKRLKTQMELEQNGHFLIGLKGELNDEAHLVSNDSGDDEWNQRTSVRTLHVEIVKDKRQELELDPSPLETPGPPTTSSDKPKRSRVRVIVYVHRPFIYTFLFHPSTESLSLPSFYRNLHTFFAPLHKPLSASTSPAHVASRIAAATPESVPPSTTSFKPGSQNQPIFDLVYDPKTLTIHASIPNIPVPGSLAAEGLTLAPGGSVIPEGWTRAEALNVHSAILEIIRSTRPMPGVVGEAGERELERSVKTGRGWWVVWMRLDDKAHLEKQQQQQPEAEFETLSTDATPTSKTSMIDAEKGYFPTHDDETDPDIAVLADSREAILVRRARDAAPSGKSKARATSGIWSLGIGGGGDSSGKDTGSGWGPARLAEGVGVDARKYVEGLLSLNR